MWPRIVTIAAAILLIRHGLVHLVGTAAYACQINMKGFAENAELLSGHLHEPAQQALADFASTPAHA